MSPMSDLTFGSLLEKKRPTGVRVGLDSLGPRMVAGFPEMVPGAGLEPARLSAGDF